MVRRLDRDPEVLAYAPQMVSQALVSRGKISRTITLIGVEAARQVQATDVIADMTSGNFMDLDKGGFQIVIGESLGQKLGVRLNDTFNIVDTKGTILPAKVAGFFNTGLTDLDDTLTYAPIHYVQQVNRTPGQVSRIIVKIKDVTRGFRAFRRTTLEKLDLATVDSVGYGFQVDLAWRVAKLRLFAVKLSYENNRTARKQ